MSQFRAVALLDTFTSSICLEKVCKYQDIKKPRKCGAFFWRLLAFKWGGRWGSNPRQPESQSGTLPTELRPPLIVSAELLFAACQLPGHSGTPGRTRTCYPRLRRPMLYPDELRALESGPTHYWKIPVQAKYGRGREI